MLVFNFLIFFLHAKQLIRTESGRSHVFESDFHLKLLGCESKLASLVVIIWIQLKALLNCIWLFQMLNMLNFHQYYCFWNFYWTDNVGQDRTGPF